MQEELIHLPPLPLNGSKGLNMVASSYYYTTRKQQDGAVGAGTTVGFNPYDSNASRLIAAREILNNDGPLDF